MLSSLIWHKHNLTSDFIAIFVTDAQNISSIAATQSSVDVPLFPVKLEETVFLNSQQSPCSVSCVQIYSDPVLQIGKLKKNEFSWRVKNGTFFLLVFFFYCTAQFNEKTLILMKNLQNHLNISPIEHKIWVSKKDCLTSLWYLWSPWI